jgi:hypothetical protein
VTNPSDFLSGSRVLDKKFKIMVMMVVPAVREVDLTQRNRPCMVTGCSRPVRARERCQACLQYFEANGYDAPLEVIERRNASDARRILKSLSKPRNAPAARDERARDSGGIK